MQTISLTARRPVAADLAFLAPNPHQTETPAYEPPLSPREGSRENPVTPAMTLGDSEAVELTPKGERYAAEHIRGGTAPNVLLPARKQKIERAIDRHLSLVTVLIALLDEADGDAELEPSLVIWGSDGTDDREVDVGDEGEAFSDDLEVSEPGPFYPNGAHLAGGGSGI